MGVNFTDITTAFRFRTTDLNTPLGELDDAIETVRGTAEDAAGAVAALPTFGSIATKDFWSGTQAQYDALGTYDANTLYFIVEA